MMKACITDAKNGLSALIDRVKAGSCVLIVDRGRPVARLETVTTGTRAGDDGRLERLVREGIVRPARSTGHRAGHEPPRPTKGASVLGTLLEERRTGR